MGDSIRWTRETLHGLKLARQRARLDGKDVFLFEDHEFLARYADYLIEFLEGRLL